MRIVPATGAIELEAKVGEQPFQFASDGVHLWLTNEASDNVMRLRPSTGAIQKAYPTGENPVGVVFDGTSIWVANTDNNTVSKITRTPP